MLGERWSRELGIASTPKTSQCREVVEKIKCVEWGVRMQIAGISWWDSIRSN